MSETVGGRGLARALSPFAVLLLTLSAATPASSAFVILPDVLKEAGTGALIALIAAALIGVMVAQTYAELASAFPHAGGEYAVAARTLGRGAGFVVLVLNGVNSLLTGAALALGAADYFAAVWPGLPAVPTALAAVGASTLVGVLRLRSGALVTGVFLAVEVVALLVVIGLGLAHPERGVDLVHPVSLAGPAPVGAILLATTMGLFVYDGYGAAIYFAEELRDASARIGRVVMTAFALMVGFELAAAFAVVVGAPDLQALFGAEAPMSAFVAWRSGPAVARALSLGVGLAIVNAVIALVLLTARQLYATGRDRIWPDAASAALARVGARGGSPWVATLASGAVTAALCFVPLRLLLILTGTGLTFVYASLALSLIAGRRGGTTAHGSHRAPLAVPLAVVLLVALAGVAAAEAADPEGRASLAFTAAMAVAAALYYALWLKPRGGWRLSGPAE